MRILVVGSGGREHALAEKLAESPSVSKVFVAPGNGGTLTVAENVPVKPDAVEKLVDFACREKIDLVVPGPELPLTLGIADKLADAGIACFGPDQYASQLEGSKSFAKEVMITAGVPTAESREFTDLTSASAYIAQKKGALVIKADGLAAGKGVVVAQDMDHALAAARDFLKSHGKILVEERLKGEEVSLLCVCDGTDCLPLPSAQDHKAAFDNDEGPNTGGMGAYSPAPLLPDTDLEKMADLTVRPVLKEMSRRGHPFRGILYAGLMLTEDGPRVLEYNVRFGDPECQVILPRLESDLAQLLMAAAKGDLSDQNPQFNEKAAVGIVLAAGNYPDDYPRDLPIDGLENMNMPDTHIYHAGTTTRDGRLVSTGGRVLCVTSLADTLQNARDRAYARLSAIHMPLGRYRKDIASKGLRRLSANKHDD